MTIIDVILRLLLAAVLIFSVLVIYEVWKKVHGVDLKQIECDVRDIKTMLEPPSQKDHVTACKIGCCEHCDSSEVCSGNENCEDCLKNKAKGGNE